MSDDLKRVWSLDAFDIQEIKDMLENNRFEEEKELISMKKEIKRKTTRLINRKKYIISEFYISGNLVRLHNKFKFLSIDGREFNIVPGSLVKPPNFNKAKCVASITVNNKAIIEKILINTTNKNKISKEKNCPKKSKKINTYNIDLSILIITSSNTSILKRRGKELNLNVSIFDSYEENGKRLNNILPKYDLVLYCIGSSKHFCNDIIKSQKDYYNGNKKYVFIKDESVNKMIDIIYNHTVN